MQLAMLLGTVTIPAALLLVHRPRHTISRQLKRIRLPRIRLVDWRHRLGDQLESAWCLVVVILLIALDICSTLLVVLTENNIFRERLEGRPSEVAEAIGTKFCKHTIEAHYPDARSCFRSLSLGRF